MVSKWYKYGLIIAIILNITLLYEVYHLKTTLYLPKQQTVTRDKTNSFDLTQFTAKKTLPEAILIDRNNQTITLKELINKSELSILVLFSPADCQICLDEKELWQQIKPRTGIPVYAVASNDNANEFWQWESQINIPIEIFIDTAFTILDSLELRVRPLKILINNKGEIIWADATRLNVDEQQRFWIDLNTIIENQH